MPHPVPGRNQRFRAEWLILAAVTLGVAGLLAETLHREHARIQSREGDRLDVQARVVVENLASQLDGAGKAIDGVRIHMQHPSAAADADSLPDKLKLLTGVLPGVSTMLVQDEDGTIVATSRDELLGKNFRQREYFSVPRANGDPKLLFVSPPFKTSLNTYVMVVSRTLQSAAGGFAGVVSATLDPEYFDALMRSVVYAPDMRTALIHGDGRVFLGFPASAGWQDRDSAVLTKEASEHALGLHDGRLVATRRIDRADLHLNRPIFVTTSRELEAIYAPWRRRASQLGVLVFILLIGASVLLVVSQRRRLAYINAALAARIERQLAADRVEMALRGADLGLWDLHVPTDTFVVNAREREILGFGPEEALPQGPEWRDRIHPEDRAAVDAAIIPHLRGQAPSYEVEHRMRRADGCWIWVFTRAMIVERDDNGGVLRIVGTHLDVTERKETDRRLATAAELLRNSEDQLRQITDNLPALVSRFDGRQRLRFVNRAFQDWLHVEPEWLLGRSLQEIYGDESYAKFQGHVEAALGGNRVVYQRDMDTPDGMRRVEVTLVPDTDADNVVRGAYALALDITARHDAEQRRARSEERLSLALEGSSLALFDWDIGGGTMYHSAQAAAMCGDPPAEATLSMDALSTLIHPDDIADVEHRMKDALTGIAPVYSAEYRLRNRANEWFWLRARGRVVERGADGRALRLAGTYADITDRKDAERRLRRLAETDSLTGLPNRAVFHDRLEQAMFRAVRGSPMALLFLDIDHFKRINDTLGHAAGDEVLKVFGSRMRNTVRRSDTVARLAGDEFTIILENLAAPGDAGRMAGKLVAVLREPVALPGSGLQVTVSIGVALFALEDSDDNVLMQRADAALYEAKRRGRDGYFCAELDLFPDAQKVLGKVSQL